MKSKLFYFLILIMGSSMMVFGQDNPVKTKVIAKAYYFDKTPELRSMQAIEPYYRERGWKKLGIKNPSVEMSFENNQDNMMAPKFDATLQMTQGERTARGPEVNIAGISNVNGVYPPDTDGDVGPNHYMQMINLSFAVWDKDGNLLYGPVDNSTLWQGFIGPWTGSNDGDPIILYDDMADRWLASQFAINVGNGKYYELVAISATPDPLGEWYRYAFEYDVFIDYPKFGIWNNAYFMTTNNFNGGFVGIGAHAYERDAMLAGDPDAQMAYFEMNSWAGFSMQPADCDGIAPPDGEPGVFITRGDDNDMDFYTFVVDWDNTENTDFSFAYSLPVSYYNNNIWGIAQPNTTQELDALSNMLMYRLQYRNMGTHQAMVLNHTVNAGGVAGIRWYEFRKSAMQWELFQEGTFAPGDGLNRWMGSIAMNANGDIALGYTVSNADVFPSIRYTGRAATDPPGEMTFAEMEAIPGTASQNGISRWGDYSNMSVDPVNDSVFWHTNEYLGSGWKTRIFSFTFGPPKMPEISAGPDTVICENVIYDTQSASGKYFKSIMWETNGDGRFLPTAAMLHTDYMRGNEDIDNGTVILTVTAEGYGETGTTSDAMFLTIQKLPHTTAGNDTTICQTDILTVNGSSENAASIEWKTDGDGYFQDPFSLTTTYFPGPQDIATGQARLRLFGYAIAPCIQSYNDQLMLTIDPCVGLEKLESLPEIFITPNPVTHNARISVSPESTGATVVISDTHGKVLYYFEAKPYEESLYEVDFTEIPQGIYLVKIQTGTHIIMKKLIKK
ncbi:MAG: T9SS type A sorting domain-containing protein [Bacteroidia bacterium]|nr:T9SS type A sorting domain-containing protein [Bacteroidales bacterium]NCD40463.1 T9SS type A sorting domain-containing protein [Bacteroidia bacterium]